MANGRLQLALNATDLDAAIGFYEQLFGVAPAKQRREYANFAIADPPHKLVLFEDPDASSPRRWGETTYRPRSGAATDLGISPRWQAASATS